MYASLPAALAILALLLLGMCFLGLLGGLRYTQTRSCILYKSTTVRAYCFGLDGKPHFRRVPIHRYPFNRDVDVPILPWAVLAGDNIAYEDMQCQPAPGTRLAVSYRVYYYETGDLEQPHMAMEPAFHDLPWHGYLVVFRCSCSSQHRFVDMRRGDDAASRDVARQ
ncbi:hypothetical protein EVJ58_g4791 [Rhodofomes roseus]|uniref:Uncharacterized protein n=1 Tax=Rhodofomes roseus TaxID=34475 RepID=A0A4Y9YF63_9APHY|nr:hypothetical protein EVJ58_g4791 [Rhodofomes roseus]